MTVKLVADFRVLMRLAWVVGDAEKRGDMVTFAKATEELEVYREVV